MISGARYSGVPHNVQVLPLTLLAKPKSVTLRWNNRNTMEPTVRLHDVLEPQYPYIQTCCWQNAVPECTHVDQWGGFQASGLCRWGLRSGGTQRWALSALHKIVHGFHWNKEWQTVGWVSSNNCIQPNCLLIVSFIDFFFLHYWQDILTVIEMEVNNLIQGNVLKLQWRYTVYNFHSSILLLWQKKNSNNGKEKRCDHDHFTRNWTF